VPPGGEASGEGRAQIDILQATHEVTRRLRQASELCQRCLGAVEAPGSGQAGLAREVETLARAIATEIDGACRALQEMELPAPGSGPRQAFLGSLRELESRYRALEGAVGEADPSRVRAALDGIEAAARRVSLEGDRWVSYMTGVLADPDDRRDPT
jgi:hypothetical protein